MMLKKKLNQIPLMGMLALVACGTVSPISDQQTVTIKGRLLNSDGTAAANQRVTLSEINNPTSANTDNQGYYQFNINGIEVKDGAFARKLKFESIQSDGQSVTQSREALGANTELGEMRFWNELQQPIADSFLNGNEQRFTWNAPQSAPTDYLFELYRDGQDLVWSQTSTIGEVTLAKGIFQSNRTYQWQVTSDFTNYKARSARRTLRTGNIGNEAQIQHIKVGSKNYPALHDGSFNLNLDNNVSVSTEDPIIEIKLSRSETIRGIYIIGEKANASLQVKVSNFFNFFGPVLETRPLNDYTFIPLQGAQGDAIQLTASNNIAHTFRIKEIRVAVD